MTAAARADAKENSIAGLKPTKQAVIASYTRDHQGTNSRATEISLSEGGGG